MSISIAIVFVVIIVVVAIANTIWIWKIFTGLLLGLLDFYVCQEYHLYLWFSTYMCEGDGAGCCVPKKPFEMCSVTLLLLHFILEELFCIDPVLAAINSGTQKVYSWYPVRIKLVYCTNFVKIYCMITNMLRQNNNMEVTFPSLNLSGRFVPTQEVVSLIWRNMQ